MSNRLTVHITLHGNFKYSENLNLIQHMLPVVKETKK